VSVAEPETLAKDELQASAGERSTAVSLLHPWKGGTNWPPCRHAVGMPSAFEANVAPAFTINAETEAPLDQAHLLIRLPPRAQRMRRVGFGSEAGDLVGDVVLDPVAGDRAHAAVPLLGRARGDWPLAEGLACPRRRVCDVALGELVANDAGVALELRDAAVEAGALLARLGQPTGRHGEPVALRLEDAEVAVGAL
jgi:hypothetical protein